MPREPRPRLLVFDVNETLTDLSALAPRLAHAGLPGHLLPVWFAGVLRDGVALTLAGGDASFADVAADGLRTLAARAGLPGDPEEAVRHVLAGLPRLPVHPDVPDGVRALRAAGYRLLTLTNGSAATTRAVLDHAGLTGHFEAHVDVTGAGRWKPAREAYAHALDTAGVPPGEALLVSVHPWDTDGAARAGLTTAWLHRTPEPYPRTAHPPDWSAAGVTDLAAQLTAAPAV